MADARLGRYAQARQPGQEEAHHMLQVAIVQQGAWANPLPTFPLAVGYLKAGIDGDASLGGLAGWPIIAGRDASEV